jgi:hypothetical protein
MNFDITIPHLAINGHLLLTITWVLVFILVMGSVTLWLIGRYFVKPMLSKRLDDIGKVIEVAPVLYKIVENHEEDRTQFREMKHNVNELANIVKGVGTRMKEVEVRHEQVNEDHSKRIITLEADVKFIKEYHIRT